ncbi:hypothetical protein HYPSUDRAFT_215715 [Hypholoma sublateritium FD-334 SS-4]|uniref:MULE transposase domain-containing protein n=1 Tax=Hypholoma sublateritium (strain FD-334 SS-4) TaxID=945553 RepID=A0A0D2NUG2_HYPSF|nr:hypothetical protein HYPSUDRAFT_215715 [Hypholoma sublateritium FD-334 SS-4]
MDWKLADATPRKIMIDSGFMNGLRDHLKWKLTIEPSLSDLHPSLGNSDHTRRIINELRLKLFPKGTGFEGAQVLAEDHKSVPDNLKYVRCAERHIMDDGTVFDLIICMRPAMSKRLMKAEYVSIDTSFKRLHHKWQEFEIEAWDNKSMRSTILTRAFTTSQSAQAHFILFTRIFHFASVDTNLAPCFRHIHGHGFSVWMADAHKGQALGLGMFCQSLCIDNEEFDQYEPTKKMKLLNPYDHLRRFFRLCLVHFTRNVRELQAAISEDVRQAMLSLASSEPHQDLEGAYARISAGGKKARAWLKDKRFGSRFALPGIYQPASYIPYEIWKAAPTSSNGNEQGHRNVYRDGVGLTILGGIMRGMQFDARAETSCQLFEDQGIYSRDHQSTHFRRYERAVDRKVYVQRKTAKRSALNAHNDAHLEDADDHNHDEGTATRSTPSNILTNETGTWVETHQEYMSTDNNLDTAECDRSAENDVHSHLMLKHRRLRENATISAYSELESALTERHRLPPWRIFLDSTSPPWPVPQTEPATDVQTSSSNNLAPYSPDIHSSHFSSIRHVFGTL